MRRFILILCCLTLTACTNNQNHQLDLYNRLVDKVNNQNQVTDKSILPFDIEVYF
jgi:outer membrane biogenesis lipoprotein LolB